MKGLDCLQQYGRSASANCRFERKIERRTIVNPPAASQSCCASSSGSCLPRAKGMEEVAAGANGGGGGGDEGGGGRQEWRIFDHRGACLALPRRGPPPRYRRSQRPPHAARRAKEGGRGCGARRVRSGPNPRRTSTAAAGLALRRFCCWGGDGGSGTLTRARRTLLDFGANATEIFATTTK
jgi:hypothetical protein